MFDMTSETTPHLPGGNGLMVLLSSVLHIVVLGALVIVPALVAADRLPNVASMTAFVVAAPPAPAPPPPPPPQVNDTPARIVTANPSAAPVEAPSSIEPEPMGNMDDPTVNGTEGGISGGVAGGIVTGLQNAPPPPPPPPPAPPQAPRRIGGDIRPPVLVHRVEPTYPELAAKARVEGTVILEAIIDEDGTVQSLKVLRSVPLLDKAAVAAVEQWTYSPVILNGSPVRVILTVTVSFKIPAA
jgi:protein TonB